MRSCLIAALAMTLGAGSALADGLKIEPGLWKNETTVNTTVTTTENTMDMPAQTQSTEECISAEDATLDPNDTGMSACEVSNLVTTESDMSFDMACSQSGAVMTGQMKMSKNADGTKAEGTFSLMGSMTSKGTTVSVAGTLKSERVGGC
jgi:hypothetical protein